MSIAPVVIFLHAPKTGGTTLVRVMERQYGADLVLTLYESNCGEELTTLPPGDIDRLRAVVGHFSFGAHAYLPRPSVYITLLRDPVDRVISHYHFVRRDPTHYLHQAACELSLGEFVVACGEDEPNNDQTRLLAGSNDAGGKSLCAEDRLTTAKRNLYERFAVVGLTEEFDQSLLLMRRALGWGWPVYVRENVTKGRPRKEVVSDEVRHLIERYNALDQQLYEDVRASFREQVRAQGAAFQRELRAFRALNSLYTSGRRLKSVRQLRARGVG